MRERLDAARNRRNELAHTFWIGALPRLLGGDAQRCREELEADAATFTGLANELIDDQFATALRQRDIDPADFPNFTSIYVALLVFRPDLVAELDPLADPDALLDRMRMVIEDGNTQRRVG